MQLNHLFREVFSAFLFLLFFLGDPIIAYATKSSVMSVKEFEKAINAYEFFQQIGKTTTDQPLDKDEIQMIESAIKEQDLHCGGEFDCGRAVSNFTGDTLLVGGGKKVGDYGGNQGKTALVNYMEYENEISETIDNLRSGKWSYDHHMGRQFKTDAERNSYIQHLERKKQIYRKAFAQKNRDTLKRYYTVNINKSTQPDMLASITSESDMRKIPDNKFTCIEFENVPCQVFLIPTLYLILNRIVKPGGIIKLSVNNACRRLIAPVIKKTRFGKEFEKVLRENYCLLETLHPTYHRMTFIIQKK